MKTLRKSKFVALFGVFAIALVAMFAVAPSADAGCGGYGYGYSAYHAPVVTTHYVAPSYHVAPVRVYKPIYTPTYFNYYTPGCYYGW